MTTDDPRTISDSADGPASPVAPEPTPQVTPEETRRLAQCCAFFQAEHFREAQPGAIRESDIDIAQEQIAEVVQHCRRP